mgnify:CR=1 FL=1
MNKEQVIQLLQDGKNCLQRDCENKDKLLSEILFDAFPLKEKRTIFAPDNFFFGRKGTIWLGRYNNESGLPPIKLSSIL